MLIVGLEGQIWLLNRLVDGLVLKYRLYTADIPLDQNTVASDFTEPEWAGYAFQQNGEWTPALTINGIAVSWADPILWTRGAVGGPEDVFGFYVTVGRPDMLVYAERRDAGPIPMVNAGDQVQVLPQITLRSFFPKP
jgi:hypothetical protein